MTSETVVTQGPSPVDDVGLDAIRQHNALRNTEAFPPYQEDPNGLGIYVSRDSTGQQYLFD